MIPMVNIWSQNLIWHYCLSLIPGREANHFMRTKGIFIQSALRKELQHFGQYSVVPTFTACSDFDPSLHNLVQ